jgi:hypothetical protein
MWVGLQTLATVKELWRMPSWCVTERYPDEPARRTALVGEVREALCLEGRACAMGVDQGG